MRISFDLDGVLADMDSALAKIADAEFGVRSPGKARRPGPVGPGANPESLVAPKPTGEGGSPGPSGPGDSQGPAALLRQLTDRQQARLWQRVRDTKNFWETLAELEPGAVRRIQDLAHDLRWEALFVTQRPETAGRTAQVQSQRWLHKHGYDLPAVYTTKGSRGRMADALSLDAHIDDRLDHAVDIATESRAWSILVWRDEASFDDVAASAKRLGVAVVHTVGDALDRLEAADRGGRATRRETSAPDDQLSTRGPALLSRLRQAFGFKERSP